jgi:hypothetical protein
VDQVVGNFGTRLQNEKQNKQALQDAQRALDQKAYWRSRMD